MKEIYRAEDIDKAQVAIERFGLDYEAKYPKVVAKIVDDARCAAGVLSVSGRALGASAHHEPIESTFATMRLGTKVTKGPGSRAAGIAMAYKLIDTA